MHTFVVSVCLTKLQHCGKPEACTRFTVEKTAQSLLYRNFTIVSHRVLRFSRKIWSCWMAKFEQCH